MTDCSEGKAKYDGSEVSIEDKEKLSRDIEQPTVKPLTRKSKEILMVIQPVPRVNWFCSRLGSGRDSVGYTASSIVRVITQARYPPPWVYFGELVDTTYKLLTFASRSHGR